MDYKLIYNENEIDIDYNVYHLTRDGFKEFSLHEIQYKRKTFHGRTLEKVVRDLVKFLDRRKR